jgi:hypothetical protein
LARRTKFTHDLSPRVWLDSTMAVRKEKLSRPIATTRTTIGTHCHEWMPSGCEILWYAS